MAKEHKEENIARQKGEKLKLTRVEYLVADLRRMGIDHPKREVVAKLVNDTFRGSLRPEDRHELVDLVMAATGGQQNETGDEEVKVPETKSDTLSRERVEELARAYLEESPEATSKEVLAHVKTHGALPMKDVSFTSYTVGKLRKELGISGSSGGPRNKPKPKASGAKKKPAASGPPKPRVDEAAPQAEEVARPQSAPDLGPENQADDSRLEPSEPAHALQDQPAAPEVFRITTSAGVLEATRREGGRWRVAMDADLEEDTVAELVRDLVAALPIDVAEGW